MVKRHFRGGNLTDITYIYSMKKVSILVPEMGVIEAMADPQYMFDVVNNYLVSQGKPAAFNVSYVGLNKEVRLNNRLFTVHAEYLPHEITKTDLIIVPSFNGPAKTAITLNKGFSPWIIEQYKNGAELASLCVGSFLLAATGLLKARKCSTHWESANEFRTMFPEVELVGDAVVTHHQGIYTSGGATSYWNLLLYLVEKYTDRETAIFAAKCFSVDINRNTQAPFMVFEGLKTHGDVEVIKAQKYIEENFRQKIIVEELASKLSIGKRTFERRFKKATKSTVIEYMQRLKIEEAKRCFETSRKNINEVMLDIGYSDVKTFRELFKKLTGLTPIEYRNKYNKEVEV